LQNAAVDELTDWDKEQLRSVSVSVAAELPAVLALLYRPLQEWDQFLSRSLH
jgi:hypothetical protein